MRTAVDGVIEKNVFQYAEKNFISMPNLWVRDHAAGEEWFRFFLKHQHLSIRKSEACSLTILTPFNKRNVQTFYDNDNKVLVENPVPFCLH